MASPTLGYGQRGEAPIDAVNAWMRSTPWYAAKLAQWGQSPTNVHLSDWQKQELIRAAQANGVVVDEGHNGQEIDDSGNFQAKSHALRNTLIVAGIAGAALLTAGAAGAFAGPAAGGVGAGAASGAGAAVLPSTLTAAGSAALPAGLASGASAAGLGGGTSMAAASSIPWSPIINAGAQLFGNLFGAHQQANSAKEAADAVAAAQKYSADLQDAANKRAEAFTRAQAENAYQNTEVSRKGNYGQWLAGQHRLQAVGDLLGLGPREIPAYVPGVDPGFDAGGTAGMPSVGQAAGSGDGRGDAASLKALLDAGVSPQEAAKQFNQRYGRTTGNEAQYYDPSNHGGVATIGLPDAYLSLEPTGWSITPRSGAPASAPRTPYSTGSVGSYLSAPLPLMPVPTSPGLVMPSPFRPGSVGAYVNG